MQLHSACAVAQTPPSILTNAMHCCQDRASNSVRTAHSSALAHCKEGLDRRSPGIGDTPLLSVSVFEHAVTIQSQLNDLLLFTCTKFKPQDQIKFRVAAGQPLELLSSRECSTFGLSRRIPFHRSIACRGGKYYGPQNALDTTLAWGDILTLTATEVVSHLHFLPKPSSLSPTCLLVLLAERMMAFQKKLLIQ